jgi:cytochrome c553
MFVSDVYQGLGDVERGTIKELRVVEIFPKTTPWANTPRIGLAGEENGRAILGTVPVEADGSARFLLPAHVPVLFQALDEQGMAYQTMRSTTYAQSGERTACVGCHEHRSTSPPPLGYVPLALRRPPSAIAAGELGGRPFSYPEVVQPVLNRRCVSCHGDESVEGGIDLTGAPHEGFSRSYWTLCGDDVAWQKRRDEGDWVTQDLVPRFYMRNQIQVTRPGGAIGARGSRLMRLLKDGHEGVQLEDRELRAVAAWIDMNGIFYGVYQPEEQARQLRGELVAMPE